MDRWRARRILTHFRQGRLTPWLSTEPETDQLTGPRAARTFAHTNLAIYVPMQGPSELGSSPGARLARWDRTAELSSIEVPALVIGARHDTMDLAYMKVMAGRLPHGRYLYCPDGSHLAKYDDQAVRFTGLIGFLHGRSVLPALPGPPSAIAEYAEGGGREWVHPPGRSLSSPPPWGCWVP